MKKDEISEGNRLIAEFMGGKFTLVKSHTPNVSFKQHPRQGRNHNSTDMHPKFLSYHKSWDWLMPVVKKVFDSFIGNTEDGSFSHEHRIRVSLLNVNIGEIWKSLVDFIKWNNEK